MTGRHTELAALSRLERKRKKLKTKRCNETEGKVPFEEVSMGNTALCSVSS
jgi:hypothetical protein